jgi:hypothetical protein
MRDLNTTLRQVERNPSPDLWGRIQAARDDIPTTLAPEPSRWRALLVAGVVGIAAIWLVWTAIRPIQDDPSVFLSSGVLDVPLVGEAAATTLGDGRPVFVVHHLDGTVSVVDGVSTHVPWGLAKAVAWCPTSRTFDDVFHGAKWNEDGTYVLGPAPSGLVTYETNLLSDGTVSVGSALSPTPRDTSDRFSPAGRWCDTSQNLVYPALPGQAFDSPSEAVDVGPAGWVTVNGVLERAASGGVELCSMFTQGTSCNGAPVRGIDASGLFGTDRQFAIAGPFVARVEDGFLVDLIRTPQLESTAFPGAIDG